MRSLYAATMSAMVTLALAVSPTQAQITGPTEVIVEPGRLAQIVVTVEGESADYKILGPIDAFREFDPSATKLRIRVLGLKDGTEGHIVVAATKDGKILPLYSCRVRVGREPSPPKPPDPGPGPSPIPPAPVPSDLAKSLRDAADTDRFARVLLSDLADAFSATATLAGRSGTTQIQLQDGLAANIKKYVGELRTIAPTLRSAIQTAVDPLDEIIRPGTKDAELTPSQASRARDLFERIAKACLEAAR